MNKTAATVQPILSTFMIFIYLIIFFNLLNKVGIIKYFTVFILLLEITILFNGTTRRIFSFLE